MKENIPPKVQYLKAFEDPIVVEIQETEYFMSLRHAVKLRNELTESIEKMMNGD